jgi:hypothetical protein
VDVLADLPRLAAGDPEARNLVAQVVGPQVGDVLAEGGSLALVVRVGEYRDSGAFRLEQPPAAPGARSAAAKLAERRDPVAPADAGQIRFAASQRHAAVPVVDVLADLPGLSRGNPDAGDAIVESIPPQVRDVAANRQAAAVELRIGEDRDL